MIGINAQTGKAITDTAHLQQSIRDILTTPIGSRVMRRTYGSYLFEMIDQAANDIGLMRIKAVCVDALLRWETRLTLEKITINTTPNGRITIRLQGHYKNNTTHIEVSI